MSGSISVALGIASFWASKPIYKAFCGGAAIAVYTVAAARVWLKEREKAEKLQAQIDGKLPQLHLEIRDVIINPKPGIADCFVKVFVNNLVADAPTTLHDYRLSLVVGERVYDKNKHLKATGYAVGHDETDDDDPVPWKSHVVIDAHMEDLSEMVSAEHPLVRGSAKEGWLHFQVWGIPEWPSYQEPTGEIDHYFDEEGEEHNEQVTETVLVPRNVTSLNLSILDAFRKSHSVIAQGKILLASTKRVVSLQVEGQS